MFGYSISFDSRDSTDQASLDGSHVPLTKNYCSSGWVGQILEKIVIFWGPWSGILCLILAGASVFACLGILVGSRGAVTEDWVTEPSTYIAICTAVANQSIRFAAVQGVLIAWWIRAARGRSVEQLQEDWTAGTSFGGGLLKVRSSGSIKNLIRLRPLNLIGLACILSTVVSIDGPLLQRSSTVVSVPIANRPVPLGVNIAPELPTNWGDGAWYDAGSQQPYNGAFNKTVPSPSGTVSNTIWTVSKDKFDGSKITLWESDGPLPGIVSSCPPGRQCKAKIRAPALARTCKSVSFPADYWSPIHWRPIIWDFKYTPPLDHQGLIIGIGLIVEGQQERVNLFTQYVTEKNCSYTIHYTTCLMDSAIGEYDITVNGDGVVLESAGHPSIIALANNSYVNHTRDPALSGNPSTLSAVVDSFGWWKTTGTFYFPKLRPILHEGQWGTGPYYAYLGKAGSCPMASTTSPHEDAIASLNRLMVVQGMYAARQDSSDIESRMDPGLSLSTTVTGYLYGDHNVFHFNYWWFLAAALVEIICIALIAPTYWGWWNLRTPVSFSPIDIAKAFQSPFFADNGTNSSDSDIKHAHEMRLQLQTKTNKSGHTIFVFEPLDSQQDTNKLEV